jgi:hypothetical protein
MLLYAPTKEEVYFSLADDPSELQPAADRTLAWQLSEDGELIQDAHLHGNALVMQENARSLRQMVQSSASTMGLELVDPSTRFLTEALEGEDPFMSYDTHWSEAGHRWVAQEVAEVLRRESCP